VGRSEARVFLEDIEELEAEKPPRWIEACIRFFFEMLNAKKSSWTIFKSPRCSGNEMVSNLSRLGLINVSA
jgi:hypothetical protein